MALRLRRLMRWLGRYANLRVVVAALIALGLFAYVIDLASYGDLGGQLGEVVGRVGWAAAALAIPYFALRTLTWHLLLDQVGVRAPLRQTLAAFSAGELTKSLPGGVYLETYVLARLERLHEEAIVDAAVATVGMDVMVGTVSFLTAMAVGLPEAPWFRWLLIGVAGAWAAIYGGVWVATRLWHPQDRPGTPRWAQTLGRVLAEAVTGVERMVRPVVVRPLASTAAYLVLYALVMDLVLRAIGLERVGILAAVSVVTVTALANNFLPIPTELGLTEITGVGVLAAYGVAAPEAAIAMLGYRVLTTGPLTVLVGAVLVVLRGTLRTEPAEASGG